MDEPERQSLEEIRARLERLRQERAKLEAETQRLDQLERQLQERTLVAGEEDLLTILQQQALWQKQLLNRLYERVVVVEDGLLRIVALLQEVTGAQGSREGTE